MIPTWEKNIATNVTLSRTRRNIEKTLLGIFKDFLCNVLYSSNFSVDFKEALHFPHLHICARIITKCIKERADSSKICQSTKRKSLFLHRFKNFLLSACSLKIT